MANARRNLIHETTSHLAENYDIVVVEDLNVKDMLKNHSLAKGCLRRRLERVRAPA